jgi:hypothetical protein
MARKRKATGSGKDEGEPGRLTSTDFSPNLDKPNPSPLDFINRRMAELDGGKEGE